MAELVKTNGRTVVDYMARDYESFLSSMRELIPRKLPEWTGFESELDFGNVLLELFAHMGDILSYYQDRIANESFLGTAQSRRSIIHHLGLIGYRLATAAPAAARLELSFPATATSTVTVARGAAFTTKSRQDAPGVRFEVNAEQDLEINLDDPGSFVVDASGRKVYQKALSVEEGRLVKDELLGTSDGSPDQRFPLTRAPLILRSLGSSRSKSRDVEVRTLLGPVEEEWTLRESLAFSRAGQADFTVRIDEDDRATVCFGDGAFGRVPPRDAEVRATYRVGGGARGNVAAGSVTTLADAPELALKGAKVNNPAPATGGAERESIEHAVAHAPRVFRSLKRAVTAEDYKALALSYPGVGKVRAEAVHWNTVTLYVAPDGGGQVSDVLEEGLLAYFEDKRPVTTVIEIADVSYVPIYVTAVIEVKSYYSRDAVVEEVRRKAGELLAFERVDFGQRIFLSKFYEAIESVEGVDSTYVKEFKFRRGGELLAPREGSEGCIELTPDELATVPVEPDYPGGVKVVFKGEGGS